jgi:hypothetical protein
MVALKIPDERLSKSRLKRIFGDDIEMSIKAKRAGEIEKLRKLEKEAFGPRHGKNDFYRYLEEVWKLYRNWKLVKKSKARAKQLAEYYDIKLRKNTSPIRAIIDASSGQDARVKSRWTRALQYLEKNARQANGIGFREFVEDNGGVIGCATRMSGLKGK